MTDHYETLGVDKDADKSDIKKAYIAKSKQNHPDRGGDEKAQTALTVAYNVLKCVESRDKYDRGEADQPAAKTEKYEQYIIATFDAIINEQIAGKFRGNIIKEVKARMVQASQQNQGLAGQQRQLAKALAARLGRVKTDDPDNFYESLLNQKIAGANGTLARCEEEIEILRLALIALGHYKDTAPDKPPPSMFEGYGGTGGSYTTGYRNNIDLQD